MKILISDYDGTFYISNETINNNVETTNDFMKKNIFIIATGRSLKSIKKEVEKYNIKYNYLIINHGATIIENDNIIYNKEINNTVLDKLLNDIELENTDYNFFCSGLNSEADKLNNLTKIHISYKTEEKLQEIYSKLLNKYNNEINIYIMSNQRSLEIIDKSVNKLSAIKELIKIKQFNEDNIYTIGDNYNDIEMLEEYNGAITTIAINELKEKNYKEYINVSDYINNIQKND